MKVDFSEGKWDISLFEQITSLRTDGRKAFMQEKDCVVNDLTAERENIMTYNYISLLSREYYTVPSRFETVCSFVKFGAPLIVLSDDIVDAGDGYPAYGHHFEIVAFEEGYNVWELNGRDKPIKAGFGRFPVAANEKLTLTVEARKGEIDIILNGNKSTLALPNLPERFRAGITACEGINRFYSFKAETL